MTDGAPRTLREDDIVSEPAPRAPSLDRAREALARALARAARPPEVLEIPRGEDDELALAAE